MSMKHCRMDLPPLFQLDHIRFLRKTAAWRRSRMIVNERSFGLLAVWILLAASWSMHRKCTNGGCSCTRTRTSPKNQGVYKIRTIATGTGMRAVNKSNNSFLLCKKPQPTTHTFLFAFFNFFYVTVVFLWRSKFGNKQLLSRVFLSVVPSPPSSKRPSRV